MLGVDLGNQGAAGLLTREGVLVDVVDLPLLPDGPANRPSVNAALFAAIMREWRPTAAYVEWSARVPPMASKLRLHSEPQKRRWKRPSPCWVYP